jgi:RecT family
MKDDPTDPPGDELEIITPTTAESNPQALVPRTVGEAVLMARLFARSVIISEALRGKPADVFATIMAGLEVGLAPMAALRGIHIIKGRPALSADAMVALALSRGAAEYFRCIESTDAVATYETKRHGQPLRRMSFSIQEAERAKLLGKSDSNWANYPAAMLRARAKSALARDVYPDVLAGIYTADELMGGAHDEVIDVEVTPPSASEDSAPAESAPAAGPPSDINPIFDDQALRERVKSIFDDLQRAMGKPQLLASLRERIDALPDELTDKRVAVTMLGRLEKARKR